MKELSNIKQRQSKKSTLDRTTEAISNVGALWRGATRNIFTPELQQESRSARILADMFGGNLQRIFSGSNFESSKHHRVAVYKNMIMRTYKISLKHSKQKVIKLNDKLSLDTL